MVHSFVLYSSVGFIFFIFRMLFYNVSFCIVFFFCIFLYCIIFVLCSIVLSFIVLWIKFFFSFFLFIIYNFVFKKKGVKLFVFMTSRHPVLHINLPHLIFGSCIINSVLQLLIFLDFQSSFSVQNSVDYFKLLLLTRSTSLYKAL